MCQRTDNVIEMQPHSKKGFESRVRIKDTENDQCNFLRDRT